MIRKLGRFETAQTLTNRCAPFNVVVVLNFSAGPAVNCLGDALDSLQKMYPALRTCIGSDQKTFFFRESSVPIPLELISRVREDHWKEITEGELNLAINEAAGPLLRVTGLYESIPGGKRIGDIVLTFHHAIVDAASLVVLLNRLLLLLGEPPDSAGISGAPPADTILKESAENYFPRRYHGIRGIPGWLSFLFRQLGGEIRYRFQRGAMKKKDIRMEARNRILSAELSADLTQRLLKRSREEGTTLNHVILVSMLRSVSRHLHMGAKGPFRFFSFADLRPYLLPPVTAEHLGSYFSMMRFSVPVDFQRDFWDEARRINRKTLRAFRRGDKFYFSLTSEMIMRSMIRKKNERMGNVALSFTGSAAIMSSHGDVELNNIHSFVSNFGLGPQFCAQCRVFEERLGIDCIYLDTDFDLETAEKISLEIRTILKEAVGM